MIFKEGYRTFLILLLKYFTIWYNEIREVVSMCLFRKRRQRKKAAKLAAQQASESQQKEVVSNVETAKDEDLVKKEPEKKTEKVESLESRPFTKPVEKKTAPAKTTPKAAPRKYAGKYEVYPEGDGYKFRLKASNGEILCVSFRYTTEKGALSGIDTFIKNVEEGQFEVVTDKSKFSQFYLYNNTGARVIMLGEVYSEVKRAESAVASVKSFYKTDKIETLESIPASELREEVIQFDKVDEVATGKYEIFKEKDLFYVRLRASNAQILFISQGYASKASAKNGLETIKNAIKAKHFTISRDKQNRYQFNLYSSRWQLILAGETYPVKASGVSAAHSVLKFGLKASVVDK